MLYDLRLDKFGFECLRVKVTMASFRKKEVIFITLAPTFMDGFSFNFTQPSIMTISLKFEYEHSRMKVKVAIFRKVLSALLCFHLWTDLI